MGKTLKTSLVIFPSRIIITIMTFICVDFAYAESSGFYRFVCDDKLGQIRFETFLKGWGYIPQPRPSTLEWGGSYPDGSPYDWGHGYPTKSELLNLATNFQIYAVTLEPKEHSCNMNGNRYLLELKGGSFSRQRVSLSTETEVIVSNAYFGWSLIEDHYFLDKLKITFTEKSPAIYEVAGIYHIQGHPELSDIEKSNRFSFEFKPLPLTEKYVHEKVRQKKETIIKLANDPNAENL